MGKIAYSSEFIYAPYWPFWPIDDFTMSKKNKSGQQAQTQTRLSTNAPMSAAPQTTQTGAATPTSEQTKSKRQMKRDASAAHARRQHAQRIIVVGIVAAAVLVAAFFIFREVTRVLPGDAVALMPTSHIAENVPKPDYNSNPPTSGPHYANTAGQGLYPPDAPQMPKDENLVHNLEHGYVIMWYDCSKLDKVGCDTLQSQLQGNIVGATLSQFTPTKKLIAVPRKDFGATLALTSWGRMQKLDKFDAVAINAFIAEWREKSPEPNAS